MNFPHFYISRGEFGLRWEVRFGYRYDVGGEPILQAAEPVMMKAYKGNEYPVAPMLSLSTTEAQEAFQSLMDELWREGFRPKDIGTAGHLAATQAHLADVRALVSKAYDVKL